MGFTAVNTRQSLAAESKPDTSPDLATTAAQLLFSNANTENVTIINGTSIKGASPTTRAELMKKFFRPLIEMRELRKSRGGPLPALRDLQPRKSPPQDRNQDQSR